MALGSTIYQATLDLSDSDHHRYGSERLTLALHPSETPERMVARLLAWCLYSGAAEEGLEFGAGLSTPSEPDLQEKTLHDTLSHWIDMGEPDADRVRRACLRAQRVTVVTFGRSWQQWWKRQEKEIRKLPRAAVILLPWEDVAALARDLPRSFTWQVTVGDGGLFIVDHRSNMVALTPVLLTGQGT